MNYGFDRWKYFQCLPLAAFPLPLLNVVDLSFEFVNFNNIAVSPKIQKNQN